MKKFLKYLGNATIIIFAIFGLICAIITGLYLYGTIKPKLENKKPIEITQENLDKISSSENEFLKSIEDLINSKYYYNKDFGINSNKKLIENKKASDIKYFCESFANIASMKDKKCSSDNSFVLGYMFFDKVLEQDTCQILKDNNCDMPLLNLMDELCEKSAQTVENEIVTKDGINFYQVNPKITFGMLMIDEPIYLNKKCTQDAKDIKECIEEAKDTTSEYYKSQIRLSQNRLERCKNDYDETACKTSVRKFIGTENKLKQKENNMYKLFCIDIDNLNEGEKPFAYGVNARGEVIKGAKATRIERGLVKIIQQEKH